MAVKAVLYDLDGTLLDTLADLCASTNAAMRAWGYPERSLDEVRRFVGNGMRKLIERAVPEDLPPSEIDEILAYFRRHYARHLMDATCPYPGIADTLRALRSAGIMQGVVSNKANDATVALCDRFFPDMFAVVTGERRGIPRKPAPDIVFFALDKLGVPPEVCLYVGDSAPDIEVANNAGLRCISVSWGFRKRDELEAAGAHVIADDAEEMRRLILRDA